MTRRSAARIATVATVLLLVLTSLGGAAPRESSGEGGEGGDAGRLTVPVRWSATPPRSPTRIAVDGRSIVAGESARPAESAPSVESARPEEPGGRAQPPSTEDAGDRPSAVRSSGSDRPDSEPLPEPRPRLDRGAEPGPRADLPVLRDSADPALVLTSHAAASPVARGGDRPEARQERSGRSGVASRGPAVRPSAERNPVEGRVDDERENDRRSLDSNAFVLGPGDVLDIFVWKNPELSRRMPIRPDGRISLPLVGEIQAAGKTPVELREEITSRLEDYVQVPTVTVSVMEIKSMMVYVLGNVGSPGPLMLDRYTTVMQALSMAGGLNEFADDDEITVLRTIDDRQYRIPFDYDAVVEGEKPELDIVLQSGDIVHVP